MKAILILMTLQRKCFNAPLQQHELDGVKEVVREHEPAGVNDVGLTEVGKFLLELANGTRRL